MDRTTSKGRREKRRGKKCAPLLAALAFRYLLQFPSILTYLCRFLFFHFSLSFHFHSILISFYLVFVQVDTMDISAGVLVREGKLIRRGPRQVERTVNYGTLKLINFISQAKRSLSRLALSHLHSHDLHVPYSAVLLSPQYCALVLFSVPLGTNHRLT